MKKLTTYLLFSLILYFPLYSQIVPYDTLYNQTLTPSGNLQVSSRFFELGYPTVYSSYGADDFVCTDQWTITKVFVLGGFYNGTLHPATFGIYIYADDNPNGDLPGTQLYDVHGSVVENGNGGFTIPISDEVVLEPGHYWISVYANVAVGYAQWGWRPSDGSNNNEAVWENPGDGFGTGYTSWTPITTVFQGTSQTDYSFALFGISGIPASNPSPADNALAVGIDQHLFWQNPSNAVSINVLFGTAPNSLTSIYSGPPVSTIDQGTMEYSTDYYWRVDESDGDGTATGRTWHFSTTQNPSLVLNENFDENGFPPAGWSFENSGETLWDKYYGVSGYGQGVNSVRSKFFLSLIADSISSMITYTFYPLSEGDTLTFDYAYAAESQYFIDKLEILYSTDSGQDWESLVLLNGGPNGELVTAPHTSFEFVPNPDQWGTMKFAVPVGVNKFKFKAISAGGNDLFLDNIRILGSDTGTPVELVSFDATVVNNDVELKWQTSTEINNKGFEVEKKNSGNVGQNSWTKVSFVDGNGTTSKEHTYSYIDKNVNAGKYSYRLKQEDFDGSFKYSNVVDINISNAPAEYSLSQNYPNPFNPTTRINFSLAVDSKVTLVVYNILGQKIKVLADRNFSAGNYNFNFDASAFNSGVYLYRIEATGINGEKFNEVRKMVLTK